MAVQTQTLELPFQSGMDQKVDSRWLTIGNQSTVTNGRFVKAGAITKRFGNTLITPYVIGSSHGSWLSVTKALVGFGDSMSVVSDDPFHGVTEADAHAIYSYAPTASAAVGNMTFIDNVSECRAWRDDVVEWPLAVTSFDIAYVGGYIVIAWTALEQSSATVYTVYVNVIDAASGAQVYSNYAILPSAGGTTCVRIAAGGVYAAIVMKEAGGTASMYVKVLNTSTLAWGATTNLVTDYDTTVASGFLWDTCWLPGDASHFFILFPRRSGGVSSTKITYCSINASSVPSIAGNTTFGPPVGHNAPGHAYAVSAGSTNVMMCVAYDDGANTDIYTSYRTANSSLTSVLAETSTLAGITGTAQIKMACVATANGGDGIVIMSNGTFVKWRDINSNGTVTLSGSVLYQHILSGKPFFYDGHVYANVSCAANLVAFDSLGTSQTAPQGNYTLLDLEQGIVNGATAFCGRPVACVAPRIANTVGSPLSANFVIPNIAAVSSTQWIGIGSMAGSTSTRFALNSITYDFAGHRWQSVELGESTYMNGGILTQLDGARVTEVGFQHPPPGALSLTPKNGAGTLTNNGNYTYYVVYTWVDARGQIQRSAATTGQVTLGAADNTVTIVVNHQSMTLKQDIDSSFNPNIGIQIYRNQNGGSTFYQVLSDSAVLKSLPTSASQSYDDVTPDASLISNNYGIWPSQGGALEGYTPGSSVLLYKHNDRLWSLADDRVTWLYSTGVVVGEQVRFNDNFTVVMPEGPVTGGASMDGIFYSFTRDAIFAIAGEGPTEEGTGSNLQDPQKLPSEVGCIDSRSIVVTSLGVFFQSITGIYLLPRGGGSVMFIGQAIEDTLATYPVIKSAVLVPLHTEVRFACSTTETSTVGVELVYNYTFKAWSVFDKSVGTTSTYAAQATAVIGGDYFWCIAGQSNVNGIASSLFKENTSATATSAFLDNATWVPLTVESAWAHPSSILGYNLFQYVNVLGVNNDPHDLTVSMAIDYSTTYSIDDKFTAIDMQSWSTPLQMAQAQVADQMAAAIRVKIADSTPTGLAATTGQGPTLVGLQLMVGSLGGAYRNPPAQGA